MTTTDLIFGLAIFIGVIWLIVNTVYLSGDKNDDEFKSKPKELDKANKEPPSTGPTQ